MRRVRESTRELRYCLRRWRCCWWVSWSTLGAMISEQINKVFLKDSENVPNSSSGMSVWMESLAVQVHCGLWLRETLWAARAHTHDLQFFSSDHRTLGSLRASTFFDTTCRIWEKIVKYQNSHTFPPHGELWKNLRDFFLIILRDFFIFRGAKEEKLYTYVYRNRRMPTRV